MDKSSVLTENVKIDENQFEKANIWNTHKSTNTKNWKNLKIHAIFQDVCVKYCRKYKKLQ